MDRPISAAAILAASLVAALSPSAAQAASSRTYGSFRISTSHDQTNDWYRTHHHSVFRAANCQVLQDLGNGQYRVQTNTPGGVCRYVLRETREESKTKDGRPMTIYRVTYQRNESGRLVDFELIIAMTGTADNQTEVGMWIMANVAGRFVPVRAVSGVLEGSKSGCTSYIVKNCR